MPTDTSANNKRIAKNTLYLYFRMLLLMIVALYTSRVVLNALGVEDFGIYNVVGGVVSILGFFTSSLSNVTQRYINIGLGKEDEEETTLYFRQSFTLMLCVSIVLLVLGEILGMWFIHEKLVIPPNRITAALWVFQFSLISIVLSILQVPFVGAIVAHERMQIYAYLGIFDAVAKLLVAFLLMSVVSFDKLILYSVLIGVVSFLTFTFHVIYCRCNFSECRVRFYWGKSLISEMSRFIGCNLFGCFAWSAGIQGTNILLNLFFGPTVNAARAISVQISSAVARFTDSIMTSVKPQIIQSYVSGNRAYMILLIEKSSKYAFIFSILLAAPIMIEMNIILQFWLGIVPEYTVAFARLTLCEMLVGVFISSLWVAANATGKIKKNQVYGRMFTLAILPISYLFMRLTQEPIVPFVVAVCANIGYWLYALYDIHKQLDLDLLHYSNAVVKPAVTIGTLMLTIGVLINLLIPSESFARLILTMSFTTIIGLSAIYIMLSSQEKKYVIHIIRKITN